MTKKLVIPLVSFPRRRESSSFQKAWIPAFAGMTGFGEGVKNTPTPQLNTILEIKIPARFSLTFISEEENKVLPGKVWVRGE